MIYDRGVRKIPLAIGRCLEEKRATKIIFDARSTFLRVSDFTGLIPSVPYGPFSPSIRGRPRRRASLRNGSNENTFPRRRERARDDDDASETENTVSLYFCSAVIRHDRNILRRLWNTQSLDLHGVRAECRDLSRFVGAASVSLKKNYRLRSETALRGYSWIYPNRIPFIFILQRLWHGKTLMATTLAVMCTCILLNV